MQVLFDPALVGPRALIHALDGAGYPAEPLLEGHDDGSAVRQREMRCVWLASVAGLGGGNGFRRLSICFTSTLDGRSWVVRVFFLRRGRGCNAEAVIGPSWGRDMITPSAA